MLFLAGAGFLAGGAWSLWRAGRRPAAAVLGVAAVLSGLNGVFRL